MKALAFIKRLYDINGSPLGDLGAVTLHVVTWAVAVAIFLPPVLAILGWWWSLWA